MMDLTLTWEDGKPLYRQLYAHIRNLIQNGVLQSGAKLPSIRSLMQQLSISKTTIETAYHMLLEEGFVISKERSGLVVVGPLAAHSAASAADLDRSQQAAHPDRPLRESVQESVVDFSLLTVDRDIFPLRLWKSIMGESLSINSGAIHQYGDAQGEYELRESLARYLHQSRGAVCSPEQIVIGSGISYSFQLLARLLDDHTVTGIERPGIAQVRQAFSQNGFELVPIDLLEDGRLEHELQRQDIRMLYVTPSHRPTGDPLPYGIRRQMLEWAYANKGYIIEDDYDGELRLYGKPIPALQGLDKEGAVIYIGTFSKIFTPALRLNYMVLPLHLAHKLQGLDHALSPPSRIDQWAMQLFIARGHWYRHLRRMRKIYRKKHEAFVALLKEHMPDKVRIEGSKSGLHIELSLASPLSADRFIELALGKGVRVYGSPDAQLRSSPGNPKLYLGFGGVTLQEMEWGVKLLREAWAEALR